MSMTQIRYHIRWMIRRDMPEVLESDILTDDPWCEEDFLRVLRQRNCIGMVCEINDKVVGHTVYELHKTHLNVLRLVTSQCMRRQGVGRSFIEKLKSKMSSHRRNHFVIDVPESSLGAQLFLRSCGLKAERVIGDVYRFVYRLEPDAVRFDYGGEGEFA